MVRPRLLVQIRQEVSNLHGLTVQPRTNPNFAVDDKRAAPEASWVDKVENCRLPSALV